ncbi:hypothetical protein LAZ67_19002692 [Cordylochernes scorpioides]|uniref:Uncharacterized protein n=1 Tax=Cordylochernes scorpioides TaxID=51811 RepID=A0ABY6LIM6_9ARAC|nr:hypothetical protein LAZ67_19002692 [Cordylochernes scorpioides]
MSDSLYFLPVYQVGRDEYSLYFLPVYQDNLCLRNSLTGGTSVSVHRLCSPAVFNSCTFTGDYQNYLDRKDLGAVFKCAGVDRDLVLPGSRPIPPLICLAPTLDIFLSDSDLLMRSGPRVPHIRCLSSTKSVTDNKEEGGWSDGKVTTSGQHTSGEEIAAPKVGQLDPTQPPADFSQFTWRLCRLGTISRRLVANGLHSCRPLRRLPLTPPNRRQRLEWCRARSTWMTEWHRAVFSDESRFCLSSDSRRVRVWRRRGERSNPAAIMERPTVRQRGIMVWSAIAYNSRSPLLRIQGTMTAQRYVDDVLGPVTLPYLQGVPNALYQQDNARPHTARISQQALQDVQMLPWPPYSPDLSPIEHVWDIIGRRLHALPQPRSEDELWQMEDTNCDNLTYKGNCEEIVAEDFLILKEDNPVTESKMKSQEDTSVKLGGDCENDSSQTEPIQERCVKGGRKKGETKSILEERHKARLEEQERKLIEEGVRRSQRIKDRNNANLIMEIDHYIPENFKEAMDSGERNEWHKAMEDELSEIEKHKVWTLVPRENGMKVINSKWVYSTKKTPSDGIYKRKARLVAVGCNQRYGVDYKESFSPVLKKESLRTIVALATQQNLIIKTYDVKTAYLYGKCWNKKINEILYQLGMIRTKCDPCVYKLQRGEEYAILGLYVDDLIIAGTSKEINDNLASEIEKYVTLTEKKDSEPFIGIEIKREEDGFYLSQTHYIDTILHRFGLEECNSVQTPGDQNQNLDEYLDSKPVDKTVYQEMIGSLMYLSTGTRPDISFNVSNLSQYSDSQAAINWIQSDKITSRTKHINRKYYFVKEEIQNGIKLEYTKSEDMEADILTKSLPKDKLRKCADSLGLAD